MVSLLELNPDDKCLVIAPHADDESIGCGGLLLKYPDNCDVVVLTDGGKGGVGDERVIIVNRLAELKNAMQYANIKNYKNLMIPDREAKYNTHVLNQLNLNKYDYVFIPNKYEFHVDHSFLYRKVKKLLRFALKTKIICYEVWSPIPNPDLYLDISDVINKKTELISNYESQIRCNDYATKTISLNNYRGLRAGVEYAEGYIMVLPLIQKLKPAYQKTNELIYLSFMGIKIKFRLQRKIFRK